MKSHFVVPSQIPLPTYAGKHAISATDTVQSHQAYEAAAGYPSPGLMPTGGVTRDL